MEGLGDEDKEEHNNPESSRYSNILLLRADLIDFWHLCLTSSAWQQMIQVRKHYFHRTTLFLELRFCMLESHCQYFDTFKI